MQAPKMISAGDEPLGPRKISSTINARHQRYEHTIHQLLLRWKY